jgi:phage recombination protein Bet
MNNLPATQQTALLNFDDPEVIRTLKATVARGLSDAEFMLFAQHCKGTQLNPFKNEVWAIKGKGYTNKRGEHVEGKLQIMTGINGFFTIANANEMFDGIESGLIDPNGDYKPLAYPKNDFIGAWCKVYRKDRRIPVEAVAMLNEYDKSLDSYYPEKGIWRSMKRGMIQKCAESIALRKAFPQQLNGMYTQEEMPPEFSGPQSKQPEVLPPVVPANEIPQPEPHYYDLTNYPVEKLPKLMKNLLKIGAQQVDDVSWISPLKVKELAEYEIDPNTGGDVSYVDRAMGETAKGQPGT